MTLAVTRPRESTVVLAVLAVISCVVAGGAYVYNGQHLDFRLFYLEGVASRHGQPLYAGGQALNLNPPSLTIAVFAPLSVLPYYFAQGLWLGLTIGGIAASVRLVRRELALSIEQTIRMTALLLLMHGSFEAIVLGQLTFPLLIYPVTRAWQAYRHRRLVNAGAWLAPVVLVKPPMALLAIALAPFTWMTAASFSAAATALTMVLTGTAPWRAWLQAGGQVDWLARPFNLSLWGVAARFTGPRAGIGDLSSWWVIAILLVALVTWAQTIREANPDRRFFFAGLWSLLLTPLGWGYYLPLLLGPAMAAWPRSRLALVAYAFTWLPVGGTAAGHHHPLIDSLGFVGLAVAWLVWTIRPPAVRLASNTLQPISPPASR